MKNWTIAKRITLGFIILGILTIAVGVAGFVGLRSISSDANVLLTDSMPGALILGQAKDNLSREYSNIERLMRAKTPEQIESRKKEFDVIVASDNDILQQYVKKIVTQEDKDALAEVAQKRAAYLESVNKLMSMVGKAESGEIETYIDGELSTRYKDFRDSMQSLLDFNKENSVKTGESVKASMKMATQMIVFGVIIALVFAVLIAWKIISGTNKVLNEAINSIDDGSSQVAAASTQVSSASNMLAEGASEQAASIEETSSSLEEMSSMTAHNATSAQEAKALANEMHQAAESSAEQMKRMQAAMDAIKESSAGISQIIKTIDEIAFQTNILALNAAVEAARAGEAGAGFAVVAGEVRNLAQRSAESAKETSVKIEGAIHNSDQGVAISAKVAESLNTIVNKARAMDSLVNEIATASSEQDKGIGQLTSAVQQMDKVTQSNASNAEETASASEELNAHADLLKETVVELIKLVRSESDSRGGTTSSRTSVGVKTAVEKPAARTMKVATKSPKDKNSQHFLPMNGDGKSDNKA
jgi:methyl-accepting chemotaxis protein